MIRKASPILRELRLAAVSEDAAVAFLEKQRFGETPFCPRCGETNVYIMIQGDARNKDYRWRCRGCLKMFTVRTGTVFEETRLPLRVWVYAIWKAASGKKGYSALQLSREMEITHKSALFVLRRIRHGIGDTSVAKLTGTIEADEVYIGGKPRYKGRTDTKYWGRGTKKTPVAGVVQRGGDVRFRVVPRITAGHLRDFITENADRSCRIITDDFPAYKGVGVAFTGGHHSVRHSAKQYVRWGTDIHSNTIEGVFSLLQRGIMGTFHSVSRKHLPNYLNEFQFRWNTRKMDDGERVARAIRQMEGKRLEYRESVDQPPYFVPTSN
ncbi:MAG: IS1595 family transposase [Acidobacteriaceae bacterium]